MCYVQYVHDTGRYTWLLSKGPTSRNTGEQNGKWTDYITTPLKFFFGSLFLDPIKILGNSNTGPIRTQMLFSTTPA